MPRLYRRDRGAHGRERQLCTVGSVGFAVLTLRTPRHQLPDDKRRRNRRDRAERHATTARSDRRLPATDASETATTNKEISK